MNALAAALRLWAWTRDFAATAKDAAGKKLGASQRHGVVFPMADALAGLMAAKSFHADVKHLAFTGGDHPVVGPELESYLNTFNDLLGTIAGNVAGEAARICAEVVFGFNAADAGLTTLRETVAFMENCRFYVGNDTGTLHMAVAAGLKCVGIYSAHTVPGAWNPYGEGHIVLRHDLPCAGCLAAVCPKGSPVCIESITVDEVEAAVKRMLRQVMEQE